MASKIKNKLFVCLPRESVRTTMTKAFHKNYCTVQSLKVQQPLILVLSVSINMINCNSFLLEKGILCQLTR